MTPARRHLQRIAAIQAGQAEPKAAAAPAAIAAVAPSLAARHRLRTSAAAAAALALAATAARGAANDNEAPANSAPGADIPAYHLMILDLADDRRRLKAIQSVEAKVALKRDLLPKYSAWVDGYLQAAEATGQAAQDDVVATVMVWRMDAGDVAGALPIADVLIANGLKLPEHFARDPATYVTEEVANAGEAAAKAGKPFDLQQLLHVEQLAEGRDMPDQVRAKLYKAIGLELARQADDPAADSAVAGGRKARLGAARDAFTRALELNSACGVKKDLEKVTRELNKEQPNG